VSMFGAVSDPVSPSPWEMATFRGSSQPGPITVSDVALGDVLGIADLAHGGVDPLIEHPLPPPRPRERLDQGAVGLRLRGRRELAAVRRYDPLAPIAAMTLKERDDTSSALPVRHAVSRCWQRQDRKRSANPPHACSGCRLALATRTDSSASLVASVKIRSADERV
jgi:hypothetical protein